MATNDAPAVCRVVYLGSERRSKPIFGLSISSEKKITWRQRQAAEMEEVCSEMLRQGLHLSHVVPVQSSGDLRGGWTEGDWLYFAANPSGGR